MNISFFRRRGGSGEIRGTQIAAHLGARLNPESGFQNDLCIYVKMQPPEDYPKNSYLDIIDGNERLPWLKKHPDIGVIASSQTGYYFLERELKNKIVLIPQHHCNYERNVRDSGGVSVGVVGGKGAVPPDIPKMFPGFVWVQDFKNRLDVIKGYEKIDIQIAWREQNRPLKNPLKIINAASFGIPTIAYPELAYEEVEGYYFPHWNKAHLKKEVEDVIQGITLRFKEKIIEKAEQYHISNIGKLYKNLWKQTRN